MYFVNHNEPKTEKRYHYFDVAFLVLTMPQVTVASPTIAFLKTLAYPPPSSSITLNLDRLCQSRWTQAKSMTQGKML